MALRSKARQRRVYGTGKYKKIQLVNILSETKLLHYLSTYLRKVSRIHFSTTFFEKRIVENFRRENEHRQSDMRTRSMKITRLVIAILIWYL